MTTALHDPALFAALQRAVAGRYSLERELGAGGMGIVYLARDVRLERPVAIKLLRPALAARPEARTRFLAEARLAAGLTHPNIVPIHDVEEQGALLWYVMSFLAGRSLGDLLRVRGPLASTEMGRILREVAWALSYAHGRGVVHRDIKPDNIFLEAGGRVLVLDFGIAQRTAEVSEAIGTIGFLPPEQRLAGRPDPRSDLYALAITAAAMLRARVPGDAAEAVHWVKDGAPWAAPLLSTCLESDPGRRPESARLVAEGLVPPIAQPVHPDIRRWVGEANPLRVIAWSWTIFFGFIAWQTAPVHHQSLSTSLFFTLVAWPICWSARLWQTRRLLARGHTLAELRGALSQRAEERRQELRAKRARSGPGPGAVVMQIGIGQLAVAAFLGAAYGAPWSFLQGIVSIAALFLIVGAALHAANAGAAPKRDGVLDRRAALWKSPMGGFAVRLAGFGLSTAGRGSVGGPAAPTELLLGRTIRHLLADLPPGPRALFAGLDASVDRLERSAERLGFRARRFEAEAAADPAKRRALLAAATAARARREASLTALDTLRLALIAMRGGTADVGGVSMGIEDALAVAERVQHLAEARKELEDALE